MGSFPNRVWSGSNEQIVKIYFLGQKEAAVSLLPKFIKQKQAWRTHSAPHLIFFLFDHVGINWLMVKSGIYAPRILPLARVVHGLPSYEGKLGQLQQNLVRHFQVTLCGWSQGTIALGLFGPIHGKGLKRGTSG